MSAATTDSARRAGSPAPWIEGGMLAALVVAVLALGGETVRASYHGYLHATIGEAVLREGLLPENPYHAGTPLHYYTLYPLLGVVLGRLGPGPVWGYAALSVAAGLLFAPALDALGRAFGLTFRERRAAFVAAVLGFGGLGWLIGLAADPVPHGSVPLVALRAMTGSAAAWGWDGRLESFIGKFLNASSYACALPFMLWGLAAAVRREGRARGIVLPLAAALALNPLVGGFALLCAMGWKAIDCIRDGRAACRRWAAALLGSLALASPWLVPLVLPAPGGEELLRVRLHGHPLMNYVGPLLLLLVPGAAGWWRWEDRPRWRWLWPQALALGLLWSTHGLLAFGNEYKLARMAGLLWALPVGRWAASWLRATPLRRAVPLGLALLALPSLVLVLAAYLQWGRAHPDPPLSTSAGRLVVRPDLRGSLAPAPILQALREARPDAVVLLDPALGRETLPRGVIQGQVLAPAIARPLVVDLPQIHNHRQPDLRWRLGRARMLYHAAADDSSLAALGDLAAMFPGRPLWALTRRDQPAHGALTIAGAIPLVEQAGFTLWELAPPAAGGDPE